MANRKLCPMSMSQTGREPNGCQKEYCAWYMSGDCAINHIARSNSNVELAATPVSERECELEVNSKMISTVNSVLKGKFDYVPLNKAIKVAEELIARDIVPITRCKNCLNGELASFSKQIGEPASPEECYCNLHKCVQSPDYFCGFGKPKK